MSWKNSDAMNHESPSSATTPPRRGSASASRYRARLVPLYRILDHLTEGMVYFMVVFSPWAFGTTQNWSVWTMNVAGFSLGLLLIAKWIIRWHAGYQPPRWIPWAGSPEWHEDPYAARRRFLTRTLAVLTVLILGYCLISAVNARAVFDWTNHQFTYFECIGWLPHSYDRTSTWFAFWTYLGLAFSFWAIRDWLLGKTRREYLRHQDEESSLPTPHAAAGLHARAMPLNSRLRRVLWVLCLNGAALALVSIIQRLDATDKLLWLVKPRIGGPDFHFGPYAYRSNAAQYFNLLWPICIGFWWLLNSQFHAQRIGSTRMGSRPHVLLLPVAAVIAACPFISTSRGGFLICLVSLPVIIGILLWTSPKRSWQWKTMLALLTFLIAFGLYLGWEPLSVRLRGLRNLSADESSVERMGQYQNSLRILSDYLPAGIGPGAYTSVYWLYLDPGGKWYPYAHNDWLQTLAEWGWVGLGMIVLAFAVAWLGTIITHSGKPAFTGCVMASAGMLLIHAAVDFPLQIYSLLFLLIILTSLLVSMPQRTGPPVAVYRLEC
jgi:hypothetical protein